MGAYNNQAIVIMLRQCLGLGLLACVYCVWTSSKYGVDGVTRRQSSWHPPLPAFDGLRIRNISIMPPNFEFTPYLKPHLLSFHLSPQTTMSTSGFRICVGCHKDFFVSEYSRNQWRKGVRFSRCFTCVARGTMVRDCVSLTHA